MILCSVKKQYGKNVALDVDRAFDEGKIYAIIGNNGSGKSTLLNVLSRQIPFDGKIDCPKHVLYMPQTVYNFDFSVKTNILLFLPKNAEEKRKTAEERMEKIGLLPLAKKNAKRLSGGEGQKTALLRTLAQDCSVLLLDEPTSSMDVNSTQVAENIILDYRKKTGCTVFLVTHSVAQAERLADEILFLDAGKIVESGKDIISNPQSDALNNFLKSR